MNKFTQKDIDLFIEGFINPDEVEILSNKEVGVVTLTLTEQLNKDKSDGKNLELDEDGQSLSNINRTLSSSKIRDSKCNLLKCYHSSNNDFDKFELRDSANGRMYGSGIYFTTKDDYMFAYGKISYECYLNIINPWYFGASYEEIKNFIEKDTSKDVNEDALRKIYNKGYGSDTIIIEYYTDVLNDKGHTFKDLLLKNNYDGIIVCEDRDELEYGDNEIIVFNPNQIEIIKKYYNKSKLDEALSSQEILDMLTSFFGTTDEPEPTAMYILPNGRFLFTTPLEPSDDCDYETDEHRNIDDFLYHNDVIEDDRYLEDDGSLFAESVLNCIRFNISDEYYSFIQLNKKQPTSQQYDALLKVFDYVINNGYEQLSIIFDNQYGKQIKLKLSDYIADELLKKIKRFYVSGILTENISNKVLESLLEDIDYATPYMLRNDGKLLECGAMHPYLTSVIIQWVKNKEHVVKSLVASSLKWFYNNTNNQDTKSSIETLVKSYYKSKLYEDIDGLKLRDYNITNATKYETSIDFIYELLLSIVRETNQEFCRIRTSDIYYGSGGDDKALYARISSIGFNWYSLLFNLLTKEMNNISTITVVSDSASFGEKEDKYFKLDGKEVNQMSVEDFLTSKHDYFTEKLSKNKEMKSIIEELSKGCSLVETFGKSHPRDLNRKYNSYLAVVGIDYNL